MRTALLIVDIQNDYFPGGKMELIGSVEAAQKAEMALDLFRHKKLPVFHVRHLAIKTGATFFLPGTTGSKIHESVTPTASEAVVVKNFPNSFRNTELQESLKKWGVEHLVICGMMTHMCIDATVRAAFDLGFTCTVLHDACATKDLVFMGRTIHAAEVHASFLAALQGSFATVISVSELSL